MSQRRNTHRGNSKGISQHEFKLGTNASSRVVRDGFNDFDYLDKLSPEEFAWLAEFASADLQAFDVDPAVVGEEAAAVMNSKEFKKESRRSKNWKQNNDPYYQRARIGTTMKDAKGSDQEYLASDSYVTMEDDIEESIDAFWAEKN